MQSFKRSLANGSLALAMLGLGACAPDRPEVTEGPQIHEAEGTVVSVEGENVLIDHDDIPGFMDAMTMTFPVSDPALLEGLDKGARIRFRVVVNGASYEVDRIETLERTSTPSNPD